jgi:hypothetical protein
MDCFSVPLRVMTTSRGELRLAVERDVYAWGTTRASFDAITRSRFVQHHNCGNGMELRQVTAVLALKYVDFYTNKSFSDVTSRLVRFNSAPIQDQPHSLFSP